MHRLGLLLLTALIASTATIHPVARESLARWAARADGICATYTSRFHHLDAALRRARPARAGSVVVAALDLEARELATLAGLPAPTTRSGRVAGALALLRTDVARGRVAVDQGGPAFAVYSARRRVVVLTANREFLEDGAFACALQGGGPSAYPSGHPHPVPHRARRP